MPNLTNEDAAVIDAKAWGFRVLHNRATGILTIIGVNKLDLLDFASDSRDVQSFLEEDNQNIVSETFRGGPGANPNPRLVLQYKNDALVDVAIVEIEQKMPRAAANRVQWGKS